MLTTLNLSPRELLFIAALLDATEFMGVSDAFFGMEDDEIQQEMMLLQTSLEKKGYAEQDFDGGFTLKEDVRETVDICVNCEIFIMVDKNKTGQPQLRDLYYAKGGHIIQLREQEGAYALTPTSDADGLLANIMQDIAFRAVEPSHLQKMKIANTVLAEAKAQSDGFDSQAGVKTLMKSGCDELSARVILEGLSVKANYYAVIATVFGGDSEGVYTAMLIDTEKGIYRITSVSDDDGDALLFDPLTARQAEATLTDVIRGIPLKEEEGFV